MRAVGLTIYLILLYVINGRAQPCQTGVLDPRIQAVLRDSIKDLEPRLHRFSIEERKQITLASSNPFPRPDMQVVRITNDSVPVYIFNANHERNLPIILYFHPGGFVVPLLPFMKEECWTMSKSLKAVVFAVDYRIAPGHKFPAAVDDAYRALKWVLSDGMHYGDVSRLVVSGMSAGANLTAVICQKAKLDGIADKISLQVLNCPSLDNREHQSKYPSYSRYATGYFQTRAFIDFAQDAYADSGSFNNPEFAPMITQDLRGLPPTVMISVEFDLFHDEDELYARRLLDAGVKVWSKCFGGQIHCLVGLPSDAPEISEVLTLTRAAMTEVFQK